jgi:hypothetical protein
MPAWAIQKFKLDEALGKELGRERLAKRTLARRYGGKLLRIITSVEVAPGQLITLGDPTAKTLERLGRGGSAGVPVYQRSLVKRYNGAAPGLDLLGDHKVLAIFLTIDKAPPLVVQASGQGAKKQELRVGMSVRALGEILKGQPVEKRFFDDPASAYVFFPDLGLGYRVDGERVSELVVTQVPRRRDF